MEAGEEAAVEFAGGVAVFVLFELLLELGFDNIDGGEHVEGALFDQNILLRQVDVDFAGAMILILGLGFNKMDFDVGTITGVPRYITFQSADFPRHVGMEFVADAGVDTLDFKFFQHFSSCV